MKFNPSQNSKHFNLIFVESPAGYILKKDNDIVTNLKLLPNNIDFNFVDKQLHTILYLAAANNRPLTALYLLKTRGVNPNQTVVENLTPFHIAAIKGNLKIMGLLASTKGIKLAEKDTFGETPLFKAIERAPKELLDDVVKFIINQSPKSISIKSEDGILPISIALMRQSPSTIKILIEAGADVTKSMALIAGNMLIAQKSNPESKQENNINIFFGNNPEKESLYQSTKLIIKAYNEKHLNQDIKELSISSNNVKQGCQPPPGSYIDSQNRTCIPKSI